MDIERMTLDQIRLLSVDEQYLQGDKKNRVVHMQPWELEELGIIPPQDGRSLTQILEDEARQNETS